MFKNFFLTCPPPAVVCFQVADDRLNGLPAFGKFSFLLRHAFKLAAVLDVYILVVLLQSSVARVNDGRFWHHTGSLHQDAGLLNLFIQGVAVVRVASKASGANNECDFERGGNAHLHTKLVGVTALWS